MYSPASPVLSSLEHHHSGSVTSGGYLHHQQQQPHHHHHHLTRQSNHQQQQEGQCLKFKYFTTFLVSTTCLALLSASLASHKWIISKPIRILKLNGGQTNFTSLMLTAQNERFDESILDSGSSHGNSNNNFIPTIRTRRSASRHHSSPSHYSSTNQHPSTHSRSSLWDSSDGINNNEAVHQSTNRLNLPPQTLRHQSPAIPLPSKFINGDQLIEQQHPAIENQQYSTQHHPSQNNKFQGEIYFGLFKGVKVLNYGFGDRVSPISVLQAYYAKDNNNNQQEFINFKLWLVTVSGVSVAILFALIGSIFAIINFVMTPRGTLTGPVGLVVWNAVACFSCLLAIVSWLIEYFVRLQENVLTVEEVQNGWTSDGRSQFGYSYYFVVLAFVLHLVNIFIVSIVQFESWTSNKAAKRESRAACEGVIMLY